MTTTAGLLSKGSKDYVDALAAIKAFEEEAVRVCRDAYNRYRPQAVSKMGLIDTHCEDHDDNKEPENRYAELGVWQTTKSRRETFYVYLIWDGAKDGATEISACVSLEFSNRSDRSKYAKLLRKNGSIELGDDGSCPYLMSRKELKDLSSWAETFNELLNEWLACWPAGRRLK